MMDLTLGMETAFRPHLSGRRVSSVKPISRGFLLSAAIILQSIDNIFLSD